MSEATELQTNTHHVSASKLRARLLKTLLQIRRKGGDVVSSGPCDADLPRGRKPAGPCEPGLGRLAALGLWRLSTWAATLTAAAPTASGRWGLLGHVAFDKNPH